MTSGGVVVSKIGEEGRKNKPEKSFFAGVPNEACDGKGAKGRKAPGLSLVRALTSVWSEVTLFQTMSGPTWLPPKQPEPSRVPQGRALPRGTLGPPTAHGASKCSPHIPRSGRRATGHLPSPFLPCLSASCCPFSKPEALVLVQVSLTLSPFPDSQVGEGGEAPQKGGFNEVPSPQSHLSSLPLVLQPHPRVNFCPLPPEQCYQPPGVPEDRGPTWAGSHGAPQHLQVRIGGEGRISLGVKVRDAKVGVVICICSSCFGSCPRGSLQTGESSALEVWMLR